MLSETTSSEEDIVGKLKFDRVELAELSGSISGSTDSKSSLWPLLDSS